MIILKNSSRTFDPRLDRVEQFDPRSKQFLIRDLHKKKKFRSYTWSCSLRLDQGNQGSCVGNGITHELAARPAPVKNLDEKFAVQQIYWEAQKIDPWAGGAYPNAFPYYEGTSVLAGIKTAKSLGYFKEYRCALTIDDVIMGVGHNGPAVMGTKWFKGMLNTDSEGFIHPIGKIVGGHCWLLNKVSLSEGYLGGINSWGSSWGENGGFKISFNDLEMLLNNSGEAWWFIHRHNVPHTN